ncbi:MAG: phenol hydroxylase subunit P4 [Herbaspirillum sp.]
MAVMAIKPYVGEVKDNVERFHGNQLLYVGWEDHLLFCAPFALPFPPAMRFGDVVEKVLPGAFGVHPDWTQVNWDRAEWFKSGHSWQPDFEKTLEQNGLRHKDVIRFRTPGLTGIKGSCS